MEMAKKKAYRRHIRIGGVLESSPRGLNKLQADLWYNRKHNEKVSYKAGILHVIESNSGPTLNEYFDQTWFPRRKELNKLKSTWGADQQRYEDHIRPAIGEMKIVAIKSEHIRFLLTGLVEEKGLSTKTRDRVKSLLSVIFKRALNEKIPLVNMNPTRGIEFDDPRTGTKTPPHLKRIEDILKYFAAAEALSTTHFAYAGLSMLGGMRKSEVIPLRWDDWISENHLIEINRRMIQATSTIEKGTKAGSDEGRAVGVSDQLAKILTNHRLTTKYRRNYDFILAKDDGQCFSAGSISRINDEICEKAGVTINPHGLRHTFGRLFKRAGGSTGALQTILGHSSAAVTEIYSSLSGEQVVETRNLVQIGGQSDS
jgi:integrase